MDSSKTSRYALRLMSYIASSEAVFHTSAELSAALGIPKQYLRRLLTRLSKEKLLVSDKGRTGGFSLARSKNEILLAEIIHAIDSTPPLQSCILGFEQCRLAEKCPLHDQWVEVRQKVSRIFQSVSLADMDINITN